MNMPLCNLTVKTDIFLVNMRNEALYMPVCSIQPKTIELEPAKKNSSATVLTYSVGFMH